MAFELSDLKKHNSELLKLLTLYLPDMLWVKDTEGKYLYVNKAICDGLLMAKSLEEPLGKGDLFFALREREAHKDKPDWHTFGELCFDSDQVVIDKNMPMRFEEYGNVKGKLLYLEVFKAPFYDKDGKIIGTVGAGRDITDLKKIQNDLEESLKELERQRELFEYQANHDLLTDLPNRVLFLDRLNQSIHHAQRFNKKMAVIFIDLDNFKEINDSLGHDIGDKILIEASKRLSGQMRQYDTLSRLGGDEFCIIVNDVKGQGEIETVIGKCMQVIKEPFFICNSTLHLSMSAGISFYPNDGDDANTLLKNSDAAMYKAKRKGRNTYSFYDEEMTRMAFERIMIETELQKALKDDQLRPYFQPQMDALNGRLIGMEVLARWEHPTMGLIPPERFIPLAESNGMIIELDRIMMHKAFREFSLWKEKGLKPGKLSVNLSMKQVEESGFVPFLKSLMKETNVQSEDLELEVTETQIMNQIDSSIQILNEINGLGISIAIDDFGTGYSSLAYLKRLPITKLKIDKSFIDGLPTDPDDIAITKTIISLCENLNLSVIAEGIETEAQKDFLIQNGCTQLQGYYYARPLSTIQMDRLLEEYQKGEQYPAGDNEKKRK